MLEPAGSWFVGSKSKSFEVVRDRGRIHKENPSEEGPTGEQGGAVSTLQTRGGSVGAVADEAEPAGWSVGGVENPPAHLLPKSGEGVLHLSINKMPVIHWSGRVDFKLEIYNSF